MVIAERNNWNTKPMILPYRIKLFIKFNHKEVDKIKIGYIPEDMDDKWFIFVENNWIYFHRSWTGNLIYKCQIHQIKNNNYEIQDFMVERDLERYGNLDDKLDKKLLKHLFNSYLIHR
jgi:hypothetical protein